jgi:hypothetical protein
MANTKQLAEELKVKGNSEYTAKNYTKAKEIYTDAISMQMNKKDRAGS